MGCFSAPSTKVVQAPTLNPEQAALAKQITGWLSTQLPSATTGMPGAPVAGMISDPTISALLSTLPPHQRDYILSQAGVQPGQAGAGQQAYDAGTVYPGQRVAPISPLQQQAFGMGAGVPGQIGAAQQLGGQTLANIMQPNMNQIFDPIYGYARRAWTEDVVPQITEHFAGMDSAASGGMQKALSRSGERFGLGLAATLAPYTMQAREQQLAAVPQLGNLAQWQMPAISQLGQMGQMQRAIGQEQLTSEREKWWEAQPWAHPAWGMVSSVLPYGSPSFENIGMQQPASMGYSALTGMGSGLGLAGAGALGSIFAGGGGLTAAGLGGMTGLGATGMIGSGGLSALGAGQLALLGLSDVRLKENFVIINGALEKIKQIEGQTYNFKGQKNRSAGIIAQEVERVLPEAVMEYQGIKFIRIDAIIGLLVNAVKELNQKVEILQN